MKAEEYFKKWTSERPNLKLSFHDAGIEAIAFAEAYHREKLSLSPSAEKEEEKWISVEDELPNKYDTVAFIVESDRDYYNGRILGRTYQGNEFGYPEFATPGISFAGSKWKPIIPPNN